MVFPDLRTPCSVCDERRTEVFLQRLEKTVRISLEASRVVSILYCSDNSECKDGAADVLEERIKEFDFEQGA